MSLDGYGDSRKTIGRTERIVTYWAARLLAVTSLSLGSIVTAAGADAQVCGDVGGNHADVGGCSHVGEDVAVGAAVAQPNYALPPGYPAAPVYPGEVPCYTPAGAPYYTPGSDPCLCFATTGAVVPC